MALLKSGWLWRQSWVLKRWRLNWCDLWIDGSLMFYKTDSRSDYETRVRLKSTCMNVKHGLECAGASPPENQPRENLLVVYLRDGSTMHLCANSEDEAMAWKLSIMEAKRNPSAFIDSHNAVCITPGGGNGGVHHVWVHGDRHHSGVGEQIALGLLAGMATGAALRSFMWMPFWFC
ncbi:pleckstrin homology domain-containing family B member 1 isoform X2 [Electrophorus electricus]|uniref:pleckstrin homology domain-containing family B member 1 isoform X2 n=1 Tax=Electrophorus electricus TaxID=8005 RepID=UPI000F0A56B1|nr:pleckstrin homology domain-containing family B member 1 isoform X2 [Electrophorus electricus]